MVVILGGVLMRVFDHKDFPDVWLGMWWALQTVTTVGYGDVVPKTTVGRVVASFIMLEGIAFLAIVTAAITSTFVARAQMERRQVVAEVRRDPMLELVDRFDDLRERLERMEKALGEMNGRGSS